MTDGRSEMRRVSGGRIGLLAALAALGLAACGGGGGKSPTPGAPVLDPIEDQQIEPTRSLVLALTATDAEGDRLVYSSTALPANAALVPSTGLFVFTPDASQAGTSQTITFTVSDGEQEDHERVRIRVTRSVPPTNLSPDLAPIGDHTVRAGSTLTLQQSATDPENDRITFSVHPALPPNATYDSHTGRFTFAPSAAQKGTYPFSFVASDGNSADYETVHIAVTDGDTPCAVSTPAGCAPLPTATPSTPAPPSATPATPPNLVITNQCYTVSSGSYTYNYVNVAEGGQLIFLDDGGTIDFRVSSMLVEQGGSVQAGSLECPFGSADGKLKIGLWGTDPTQQGTVLSPTPAGITCVGTTMNPGECFDPALTESPHYCMEPDPSGTWSPSDPCNVTLPSDQQQANGNALFEGYDALNFDYGENYFGYKVFAVSYGGSVQFFGRKGVADADLSPTPPTTCDTPENQYDVNQWAALSGSSWARLDQTVSAGQTMVTLDRPVDWEEGDQVVVATTDWYPSHSELMEVQSASTTGGQTTLTLDGQFSYAHNGQTYAVPETLRTNAGNPNTEVELRAPVGLLTRSIVIYSLGETPDQPFPSPPSGNEQPSQEWLNCSYANNGATPSPAATPSATPSATSSPTVAPHPECYFGGHVIVRQGFGTFQAQGVEFRQLGQGGRMGHYPMHFHLAKSTDYTDAFLKDSSIWDSMNRFVVLHASHGITVARNVGFLSIGHAYYLEDGSEIENLLCHNLAVSVRGALNEFFAAQPVQDPSYRFVPPILDATEEEAGGTCAFGGDTLLPTAFWTMNTWNELVGNAASGVYGFGSCYWLLGSGVSGPSNSPDFTWSKNTDSPADYADFNLAGTQQAPLKRFRGNSCSSAGYGLQSTLQIEPVGNTPLLTGFTPSTNPYLTNNPTQFDRPMVTGNYLPVKYGTNPSCASGYPEESQFASNPDYCVTTVIDRFTTSFNRAGANFAAVWLRPEWFVFMNGAVTDQLAGGLTFVTGGSWTQTPPGYFAITKNSVFVGSTQPDNPDAAPIGPAVCPSPTPSTTCAQACSGGVCPLPADGIGLFTGGLNPKRMISIYDGPFYADGTVFTDTSPLTCNTTGPAPYNDPNGCQIYSSTTQPEYQNPNPTPGATPQPQMNVVNAAVGWKQPNGFYYPPAFAFRKSAFDTATFRHNVIDQYANYLQGSLAAPDCTTTPSGCPARFVPLGETYPGITPIDFSTILNDMDGSLTGWVPQGGTRTSSVSKNVFFDAPSQDAECQSFGVQTAPYEFVSSVIAPLGGTSPNQYVDPTVWGIANLPAVPIYRQLALPDDQCLGDQSVCCAPGQQDCPVGTVGCTRASFMLGGQNGQAPYLTSNNGVYYIDTNKQEDNPSCFMQAQVFEPGFAADQSYVLYNLFANENTKVTYQLYVGDGFQASAGQWVLVQPHVFSTSSGQGGNATVVTPITDAPTLATLNAGVSVSNGILQVVLNHSAIADDYLFSSRPDYDVCLPRDICQIDTSSPTPTSCTIQAQPSFLDGNATDYADYQAAVTDICEYWATATAGRTSLPNTPGDDADDPIFADCPTGGCLGYAFTLPSSFTPMPYAAVAPTPGCFEAGTWNISMSSIDPDCPTPAPPDPSAFCSGGTPTPTPGTPGATPTATATNGQLATATATGTGPAATETPTVPPTTAAATATATPGIATPTPTGSLPEATPTPTPLTTPTGSLVWVLNGSTTTATLTGISTSGTTYTQGQLALQDAQQRFCTATGTFPVLQVVVSSTDLQTIGLFPVTSMETVGISALPAVSAGTYDVQIQTFPGCDSTKPPIFITMPSAIMYE